MVSSSYAFEAALGLGRMLGFERARRALTDGLAEQSQFFVHSRIEALVDLHVRRPPLFLWRWVEVPVAIRVKHQREDERAVIAERLAVDVDAQGLVTVVNIAVGCPQISISTTPGVESSS